MSWRQIALKHCSVVRSSNVDKKAHAGEVPIRLINYTDVSYGDRLRPTDDLMTATASPDQIRHFRLQSGDVIITKDSETPEDIGVSAFVDEGADDLVCGYHLAVIRPAKAQVDGRFLCYVMRSKRIRDHLASMARGVTRFGLRLDDIGSVQFECPAFSNQRDIADYLDRETTRIDGLITKKQRLLDLLEEQ